ncbi:hypothetical protein [Candidatus Coxiella mudrowiae]|uniref:hypothetical protein n=1 Tax=Candidatus Coxiella mudrowiae TaxID=2054173 RepID=UPI000662B98F|nr:hypothetical protein [Candidatus Coxiella mudrowiae]
MAVGVFGQIQTYNGGQHAISDFCELFLDTMKLSSESVKHTFFQDDIAVLFGIFFSFQRNGPLGMSACRDIVIDCRQLF